MKALKNITTLTIAIVMAVFCLAQLSQKKTATICNKSGQEATTSVSDVEDFSLINLLTVKFM